LKRLAIKNPDRFQIRGSGNQYSTSCVVKGFHILNASANNYQDLHKISTIKLKCRGVTLYRKEINKPPYMYEKVALEFKIIFIKLLLTSSTH